MRHLPIVPRAKVVSALAMLLALTAGGAFAIEFTVEASGFSFTPSSLPIQVGDQVTWVNLGGLHNVVAQDGSFRCANGCDGQPGEDGNAASNAWSFTLPFRTGATVDYFCEIHVGLGMIGTLTVDGLYGDAFESGDTTGWNAVVP